MLLRLIELSEPMNEKSFIARGYFCLGRARVFKDGNGAGIGDIRRGIELAREGELLVELKDAWLCLLERHSRLGQTAEAREAAREYIAEAERQGNERAQAEAEIQAIMGEERRM